MTEMVELADEMFNRTMAIAMFLHQRTPVLPPTIVIMWVLCIWVCMRYGRKHHVYRFRQERLCFFFRGTGLIPVLTGSELNSSLLSTSRLQDTLENFLANFVCVGGHIYYVSQQPFLRVGQWGAVRSLLQWNRELISCAWLVSLDATDITGRKSTFGK